MESLEPQHWSGDTLAEAMVLFKNVFTVLDLQDFDPAPGPTELQDHVPDLKPSQIGPTLVDDDPVRHVAFCDNAFEEPPRGSRIAAFLPQEVKGLTVSIDGAVRSGPLAWLC